MWFRALGCLLLLIAALLAGLWWDYQQVVTLPVITGEAKLIEIEKGDSFSKITRKLGHQDIAIRPLWFKALAYQKKSQQTFKNRGVSFATRDDYAPDSGLAGFG